MDLAVSFLRVSWDWRRQPWKAPSRETGTHGWLIHVCFSILCTGFPNIFNKNFLDLLQLIRTSSYPFFCLDPMYSWSRHLWGTTGVMFISIPTFTDLVPPPSLGEPLVLWGTTLRLLTTTGYPSRCASCTLCSWCPWDSVRPHHPSFHPTGVSILSVCGHCTWLVTPRCATSWRATALLDTVSIISVVSAKVTLWFVGMWGNQDPPR